MKIKSITIIGRRWFDKRWGNTYCSSAIFVNGKRMGRTDPQYGYGDYYIQLAWEWLEAKDMIKDRGHYENGSSEPGYQYCIRKNITYFTEVTDITRKKDL